MKGCCSSCRHLSLDQGLLTKDSCNLQMIRSISFSQNYDSHWEFLRTVSMISRQPNFSNFWEEIFWILWIWYQQWRFEMHVNGLSSWVHFVSDKSAFSFVSNWKDVSEKNTMTRNNKNIFSIGTKPLLKDFFEKSLWNNTQIMTS